MVQSASASFCKIIALLLAANFLFGVAVIAILPPFEGIDETAHYSRIKSQAFVPQNSAPAKKGETPPQQRIAKEVTDYYRNSPMPFGWISFPTLHADDPQRGYMTYPDFFKTPHVDDYARLYRAAPLPANFEPGPETNWQYQHPPLYYLALAPVMKLVAGNMSMVSAILVLRLASFTLAFLGLAIGAGATWKYLYSLAMPDAGAIVALGLLYPFLMPEFFWEFARLGNDSMCLFLFGIVWAMLLWHLRAPRSDAWLYLGFFMGLCGLVKAIMAPVTLGIVAFLVLYHVLVIRKEVDHKCDWWMAPLKTVGLLVLIGAPFYLVSYIQSGEMGSGEVGNFLHKANIARLLGKYLTWPVLRDGLSEIFYTGIWGWGYPSWSELAIDFPVFLYDALYVFVAIILFTYLLNVRYRLGPLVQLVFFPLGPMAAGLIAHVFVVRILAPDAVFAPATPGYYVHILAPCFVLMFGFGLEWLLERRRIGLATGVAITAVILFNFYILWFYATAFAGCAVPFYKGNIYWLHPADTWACAGRFGQVYEHLSLLAWPQMALTCAGLTFACLLTAAVFTLAAPRLRDPERL